MKKIVLFLLVVLVLTAAGVYVLEAKPKDGPQMARWNEFQFRELRRVRARSCQFVFTSPALPDDEAELRLVFELQPKTSDRYENYYFVSVQRDQATLGKAECGVEVVLGRWTGDADAGEPPFAEQQHVTVMRTPGKVSVAAGHRKVIEVCDDTFTHGRAAVGARGLPDELRPRVSPRRAGEIYAADDFMRTKEDGATWEVIAGSWAVDSLKHPGLSANAFAYAGRPGAQAPGIALLGESWWDDYTLEVSAKPAGTNGVGVTFRYADDANHYLFRHVDTDQGGRLQLVRVSGGEETVLAEAPAALQADEWYRFQVTACGPLITAYVDDHLVCRARDPAISFGPVGLYVADKRGAEFDDVFVRSERGVIEDFGEGAPAWYQKGGEWAIDETGGSPRLRGAGPSKDSLEAGRLLGGEPRWADYRVATTLSPDSSGRVGIVFAYRDEAEYGEFVYDIAAGRYELAFVEDGGRRVVATAPAQRLGAARELAVDLAGGAVLCEADGSTVLSHCDARRRRGKAGLSVGAGGEAFFENLAVTFPREAEPVLTQLDVFARESTMANWAAAKSDWEERTTHVRGRTRQVRWHRAVFPGGSELRIGAFFSSNQAGTLRLFTACDLESSPSQRRITRGYELVVGSPGAGDTAGRLRLFRNGKEAAARDIAALRGNNRIALRRVGGYVVAEINGEAALLFKDPDPLGGWSAGYSAEGVRVKPADVDVFCANTTSYSFVRAASDWRTAGGEWEVTNRWRCDPRWSFFGGENMSGICAIWNKKAYSGDLCIEFAAGIRHQQSRGGYSRHARDMNVTICGDGASLKSGYSFMFGANGNRETIMTRNGIEVARCAQTIPGNIHRRWFYFKVEKRGGTIKYYIDNELALQYTDPDPLPGGKVAVWTWQNGLMVAKVRIAAESVGPKDRFDAKFPQRSPCRYGQ